MGPPSTTVSTAMIAPPLSHYTPLTSMHHPQHMGGMPLPPHHQQQMHAPVPPMGAPHPMAGMGARPMSHPGMPPSPTGNHHMAPSPPANHHMGASAPGNPLMGASAPGNPHMGASAPGNLHMGGMQQHHQHNMHTMSNQVLTCILYRATCSTCLNSSITHISQHEDSPSFPA